MRQLSDEAALWQASVDSFGAIADGSAALTVRGRDVNGRVGTQTLRAQIDRAGTGSFPSRAGDGSDRDSLRECREKGILGTQLGLNRNGRKW